ncbi:MAG: GNAT family N-acetyltransferase [Bradyrhizobium sp.]|nr:GNAT family N-acetyltransferase [Bradyrhizobium sp.]
MNEAALLLISAIDVTPATPLAAALLALNNAHAEELSWLAPERLTHLIAEAFYAHRIGVVDAFLLAFDQDADYDSPNFIWFRERYPRFIYVDRIVVASSARGRGLARLLYRDLFAEAVRAGHACVACEVNSEPPNAASDAFHAGQGFSEVGSASIHDGRKTVRYLLRRLEDQAALAGGRASTE